MAEQGEDLQAIGELVAEAWIQLSVAAKAAGKPATALDAADRAAKLAPADPNAARALSQMQDVTSGRRERLGRSIVVLFVVGFVLTWVGVGEWLGNLRSASSCASTLPGEGCSGFTGAAVFGVVVLVIGVVMLAVAVFRWLRWRSVP